MSQNGSTMTSQTESTEERRLAVAVARCPLIEVARRDQRHPCAGVVSEQRVSRGEFQVPEGWAGALSLARIAFISSNPSLSMERPDRPRGHMEAYPRASWPDNYIADFLTARFGSPEAGSPATNDGRHRRFDGTYSTRVAFWHRIRKRASELLAYDAEPGSDYVMTEVVHCKSKSERGVSRAAQTCAEQWLEQILALTPARLWIVVGAKARDRAREAWALPPGFGRRESMSDMREQLTAIQFGGRSRLVAYLPHLTGMEKARTFADVYGLRVALLRAVAYHELAPLDALRQREVG